MGQAKWDVKDKALGAAWLVLCVLVGILWTDLKDDIARAEAASEAASERIAQASDKQAENTDRISDALLHHLSKAKPTADIIVDLTNDPELRVGVTQYQSGNFDLVAKQLIPLMNDRNPNAIAALRFMRTDLRGRLEAGQLSPVEAEGARVFLTSTSGAEAPFEIRELGPYRPLDEGSD